MRVSVDFRALHPVTVSSSTGRCLALPFLTPTELRFFSYLARHAGHVVSDDAVYRAVFPGSLREVAQVGWHWKRLKDKLPRGLVLRLRGRGFILDLPADSVTVVDSDPSAEVR